MSEFFASYLLFVVRSDFLVDPILRIAAPENLRAPGKLSRIANAKSAKKDFAGSGDEALYVWV